MAFSSVLTSGFSAAFLSSAFTSAFGSTGLTSAGFTLPFVSPLTGETAGEAAGLAGAVALGAGDGVVGFAFGAAVPEQADAKAADAAKTVPRITDLLIVFSFTLTDPRGSFRYTERANGTPPHYASRADGTKRITVKRPVSERTSPNLANKERGRESFLQLFREDFC